MAASIATSRLREAGWHPVGSPPRGTLLFRKGDAQLSIALHPRRPESVYMADLLMRAPQCHAACSADAAEEPLEQIAGFDILIDPGETAPADVTSLLQALDALCRGAGGAGLHFEPLEPRRAPEGDPDAPAPRIRMMRARPKTEGAPDADALRAAWRATVACLAKRALPTIERRRRAWLEAMLESAPAPASPRLRQAVETCLEAVDAAERTIHEKGGLLRYPAAPFLRELEAGPATRPREGALRERACRELKEADRLPSISSGVLRILDAAAGVLQSRLDFGDLERAVERDPAIAARVVHRATRADIPIPRRAKSRMTIAQATRLLGAQRVRSLALAGELIARNRTGPCPAFDYELFWQESTARASAAQVIAAASGRAEITPDEAYTAGLLCQIGRLALATAFPQEYARVLEEAAGSPRQLRALEFERFKVDHDEVAAEMMADWRMADLKEAVLHQESPELLRKTREGTLARILQWSAGIWEIVRRGGEGVDRALLDATVERALDLGVGSWGLAEEFDRIRESWAGEADLLTVPSLSVEPWERILAKAA